MKASQSCQTLCEHMDTSLTGSSVHGIFQARVLEWVAIPSPVVQLFKYFWKLSTFICTPIVIHAPFIGKNIALISVIVFVSIVATSL